MDSIMIYFSVERKTHFLIIIFHSVLNNVNGRER